jgi:hypothetical protein
MVYVETTASKSGKTAQFAQLYRCNAHWLATGEGSPCWDGEPGEAAAALSSPPSLSDLERDVLQALRALPPEERLTAVADLVARAEKQRYLGQHAVSEAPQLPAPSADGVVRP